MGGTPYIHTHTPNSSPGCSDSEGLCGLGLLTPGVSYFPTRRRKGSKCLLDPKHLLPLQYSKGKAPGFSIALPLPSALPPQVPHISLLSERMRRWDPQNDLPPPPFCRPNCCLLVDKQCHISALTSSPACNLLPLAKGLLLGPVQQGLVT